MDFDESPTGGNEVDRAAELPRIGFVLMRHSHVRVARDRFGCVLNGCSLGHRPVIQNPDEIWRESRRSFVRVALHADRDVQRPRVRPLRPDLSETRVLRAADRELREGERHLTAVWKREERSLQVLEAASRLGELLRNHDFLVLERLIPLAEEEAAAQ